MNQQEIFDVIKKVTGQRNLITLSRAYIEITPTLSAALLLGQLIYWTDKTKNPGGLIYKTNQEFAKELGISVSSVQRAKKKLIDIDLVVTELHRANGSPTTHYKVNINTFLDLLNTNNGFAQSEQMDKVNVSKSITETITETTNNLSTSVDKVASDEDIPTNILPDRVEKYREGEEINKYWKSVGLKRGHRSLQSNFLISGKYGGSERKSLPVWAPITVAIRNIGKKQLKKAIRNYKVYQDRSDEYTKSANLSLAEFCHNTTYVTYIDSVPLNEFQSSNPWDIERKRFSPLTSAYVAIFDQNTQRYYGFQTNIINSAIRWEDTAYKMVNPNEKWDFNAFMELEWMIAGLLWRRKKADKENDLEICRKYIDKWEELIPQFKKKARKWLKEDFELYG